VPVGDSPDIIWLRPERPARGPRPAYSRAQITEAAIRVADAEGLEAASMRRVAAEIGAGTMSLYRYVPRREDLIELMLDAVLGELDLPDQPTGDWRADLTRLASSLRTLSLRHPWLTRLPQTRRVPGPNALRLLEFGGGTLDGYDLSIDEMMVLFGIFNGYVDGFVREEVSWAEEERRTGMDRDQWMAHSSPYIHHLLSSGDHPVLRKIVIDARQPHMDPDARFEYGLERILDTIAASLPTPAHDDCREPRPSRP
jgi:AcrR family transcriptional regulator